MGSLLFVICHLTLKGSLMGTGITISLTNVFYNIFLGISR
jgi:hypothetical protein